MPTPTKGPRLGGSPAHERILLANLATALFEHGRITTTHAKAKRLRPLAERLITKAKQGDLHARRQVMRTIRDKSVAHALFTDIRERYENRPGGYTRITKIGPRKGDNAPMAVIELVESLTIAQTAVGEAEAATRRTARDRAGSTSTSVTAGTGAGVTDDAGEHAADTADQAAAAAALAEDAEAEGDAQGAAAAAGTAADAAAEATSAAAAAGDDPSAEVAGQAQAHADVAEQAATAAADGEDSSATDTVTGTGTGTA